MSGCLRTCSRSADDRRIEHDYSRDDIHTHATRIKSRPLVNGSGRLIMEFEVGNITKAVAAATLGLVLAGCTGTPMKTQQYDSSQYTVIGHSEGKATGIMLFNLIPIKQNTRFVRAQNAAIKAKGGDALINTQVQESWFWAWVLNGYTTTVSGDVIRLNK